MRSAVALWILFALAACGADRRPQTAAATSSDPVPSGVPTTSPTTTAPTTTTPVDPVALTAQLQSVVDGFTARQPVPFSVVVVDLATGARASHLADESVLSASLYKLFVARELIRRIDAGELSRDAPAGDTMNRTVGQCLEAMIVVSDNACGAAGLHLVGGGALDAQLRRDGFVSTSPRKSAEHERRRRGPVPRTSS